MKRTVKILLTFFLLITIASRINAQLGGKIDDAYNDVTTDILQHDNEGAETEEVIVDSIQEGEKTKEGMNAQQLPLWQRPEITTWVEKRKVKLGHLVNFFIEINRDKDMKLHMPKDVSFGEFELLDKKLSTTPAKNNRVIDKYHLRLIAMKPGVGQIPQIKFGGVTSDGKVIYLESESLAIEVLDPTEGKELKLKDIAEVMKLYEKNYLLLYFLGIITAVFALISGVWYTARKWERSRPRKKEPASPPRPPHEIACEKLNRLKSNLPKDRKSKNNWYIELSEALREYLGNRFDFDALESTTEEIISHMKTIKTVGVTQAELWKLLNSCDVVKFAKYLPSSEEDMETINEAFRIVEATMTPHLHQQEGSQENMGRSKTRNYGNYMRK